jgi:hypothetical protein
MSGSMATTTAANSFLQRFIGAMSLDAAIYEEVEADAGATSQALAVVVLSSVATGLGSRSLGGNTVSNVVFVTVVALLAWAAWALLTFEIGSRLMPSRDTAVDVGELLRTIGFASAPGVLHIFGIIPSVTGPAFAIASIWMLAAMVVAVRQALDYTSTARAVAVCLAGWTLAIALAVVLGLVFGPALS